MNKLYPKQNCKTLNKRFENFIRRAEERHGTKYDYSQVEYINSHTPIAIICPHHGTFTQKAYSHLAHGCNKCGNRTTKNKLRLKQNEFIERAKTIHNNFYTYESTKYKNSKTKIIINCPKHGIFKQQPSNHLQGRGCPVCKKSHGERTIYSYLKEHNINFISQKTFELCINPKSMRKLPFDFFLPEYNILIEYDGQQHFSASSIYYNTKRYKTPVDGFIETKIRDDIKNKFAKNNGYLLIRIPWNKNISVTLTDLFTSQTSSFVG